MILPERIEMKAGNNRTKKKPARIKKWCVVLLVVLVIILACRLSLPYRYSAKIAELKNENAEDFEIFPDSLPESAVAAQWECFPGFMQGAPFYRLTFKADKEYIQALIHQYENNATVYTYDTEDWSIRRRLPSVKSIICSADAENVKVYETNYNLAGWDHYSGFYVDEENCIVGFYLQISN